jgi:hypothetical protein
MHLLISTPLQIIALDLNTRSPSVIRAGDGYYFGITHHLGTIVLTTADFLQFFRTNSSPCHSAERLMQPHQIEWVGDRILVADTGHNCLAVFDSQAKLLNRVYLNDIKEDDKDRGRLGNHFNSVHKAGNRVYVVAHNYERPSEVWELTWPDLEIIGNSVTKAGWAHNIWPGEMGLVICDSRNGSLFEVTTQETLWKSPDKHAFTRGLAVSQELIFVGGSQYQERRERFWKTGKVWIVDRKTLKNLDEIVLPGSGDVQELRIVDDMDDCHNGETIGMAAVEAIRRKSTVIQTAYRLRQSFPKLQRDIFPISQLVRGVQFFPRWRKKRKLSLSRKFLTNEH